MPAPKNNKFAIGNSGTDKMYKSPEELQKDIDSYFEMTDQMHIYTHQANQGKDVLLKNKFPYSIEGLALHMNTNRRTLLNYEKKEGYEDYFHIITHAKEKIRMHQISYSMVGAYKENFVKFIMVNNSDYRDSTKVDHSSPDGTMTPKSTIIVTDKEAASELDKLESRNE